MSAGSPHPKAETGGPFEGDAPVLAAGCSVEPRTGVAAGTESPDRDSDAQRLPEACVELARVLDPEAINATGSLSLNEAGEILHRQDVALGYAAAAVQAGWRRVVEDEQTVDRVTEAMAAAVEWPYQSWDPLRIMARAVVRALREET